MSDFDEPKESPHIERVDADAVCQQCGTVNPENTLICKTCGNNLRDQRANRMIETLDLDRIPQPNRSFLFLRVAIMVLAILIFVWVGLNLGNIEDMMMQAQMAKTSDLNHFWKGPDQAAFDDLSQTLHHSKYTNSQLQQAINAPVASDNLDGIYVLFGKGATKRPLGKVAVKTSGEKVLFVILLEDLEEDYQTEIRGEAVKEEANRITCSGNASFREGNEYFDGSGFATRQADGTYSCYAQSNYTDISFSAVAYSLPSE